VVREEYEDILKGEVQRAISADEDAITRLCANYIENVRAYTQHEKVRNKYTGKDEEPDERLMRSIEEKIDIPDSAQGRLPPGDHELHRRPGAGRQEVRVPHQRPAASRHSSSSCSRTRATRSSSRTSVSGVVDDETQAKIDVVKQRLIKFFGYNETSATDVLNYVASIFARGDAKSND
jgi:serine protein kinase